MSWLIHQTHITRGAAVGHTAWAKRTGTHPKVLAALAAGQVTESVGRLICLWTGKLPEQYRDEPTSCCSRPRPRGWGWRSWPRCPRRCTSGPAATCPMRTRTGTSPTAALKLATTFGGAGVMHGDLTAGVRRAGRAGAGRAGRPGRQRR